MGGREFVLCSRKKKKSRRLRPLAEFKKAKSMEGMSNTGLDRSIFGYRKVWRRERKGIGIHPTCPLQILSRGCAYAIGAYDVYV